MSYATVPALFFMLMLMCVCVCLCCIVHREMNREMKRKESIMQMIL